MDKTMNRSTYGSSCVAKRNNDAAKECMALINGFSKAKRDYVEAQTAYGEARFRFRVTLIAGILGALLVNYMATKYSTPRFDLHVVCLLVGVVIGWGYAGVFRILGDLCIIALTNLFLAFFFIGFSVFAAGIIGIPVFLYDLYRLKKAKKRLNSVKTRGESIAARAADLGFNLY